MLSSADNQSTDARQPTPQCAWAKYPLPSFSLRTVAWIGVVLPARRRAVRWPHASAVHARPPPSCPAGSPFFSNQILQHRDVQCLIGHDALQLRVLFFELLQPFRLAYFESAVLTAPSVKRRCTDPMLPAQLARLSTRFTLLQYPDNLFFAEPAVLHSFVFLP